MSEWEDNSRATGWQDQPMNETPAPESEAEVEELVVPQPQRERMRHDTPLDVEVVRVRRDDFDQPMTDPDDGDETGRQTPAEEERGEQTASRQRFKLIRQIVLGTILNADSMRENYRYAGLIAVMLFLSIVMLFSSLSSYLRYTKLEDEVHLLREKAIRMSEERYEHSSHSAIVRRLGERGIKLSDPQEPHEFLD